MRIVSAAILALCFSQISIAQASCLDEVASFSIRICGEIEKSGTRRVVDASGKLDANIGSIVRRVVGGGSGEVSGEVLIDNYNNVLRDQLGPELFNVRDCRIKMVDVAVKQVCKSSPPPPPPSPPTVELNSSCSYSITGFHVNCATDIGGYVVDSKDPPFYGAGSVENCARFCQARRDCAAFSYNLKARNNCFLFKIVKETRYNESIVSGQK